MQVIGEAPKHAGIEVAILFDGSDIEGVKFPYDVLLVIIHVIGNSKVKWVFVDNRDLVYNLFSDVFMKMGYRDFQPTPSNAPI